MTTMFIGGNETLDIETTSSTTDMLSGNYYVTRGDPYAGLNRAQRRKAIAVESRAARKERKRRGR